VAKQNIPQESLRVRDGWVAHDLICRQNVHGLGLHLVVRQPHCRGKKEDGN
jgi:hypothetical protein